MISAKSNERTARFCIMPVCAGKRFDLVHKFPRENHRTQDWLKAVDLPHLYNVPLQKLRSVHFICSRHFRKKDYKNAISRNLNKTAVPCINLKSLDQLEEALDTSVPRSCAPFPHQRLSSRSESTFELATVNPNEKHPGVINSVNTVKANLGYRLSTTNENYLDFDIVPSSSECGKCLPNVETFLINVVDESQLEDTVKAQYSAQLSIESGQPTDKDFAKEEQDLHGQCENIYDISAEGAEPELIDSAELQKLSTASESEMSATGLLEISHPDYSEPLKLNSFWLRDHCRCALCYNEETHQRKLNILDIPLDIKPIETEIRYNMLWIKWPGGHDSVYDIDFLFKSQSCQATDRSSYEQVLWDQDSVHHLDYSCVNFNSYLSDDEVAKSVVKSLLKLGFAFINRVPPNANMTEAAIRRLFPIQKTFFGEMWSFSDVKDHSDTAYSNGYLGSHTDNTYWHDAAGLQVFHCTKHLGSGGETFLTDGFKVISDFEIKDPKGFDQLTRVNVPGEYIENDIHYVYSAPMIRLDEATRRPVQIRYNVYDRAVFDTIPQCDMTSFYASLQSLAEEVNREENQWRFKLNPGTVLIFDNWRILHGREKYTGKRQMTGCYVARSEFLSVARVMGLLS